MALQRRSRAFRISLKPIFWAVLVLLATLTAVPLRASITERVVNDKNTGLAIYGYDPVAYFTDAKALAGKSEYELRVRGAVFRFRNEGNRSAFSQNPDVYFPRYGGYDPIGVARGVAVPGNPLLWAVAGERLYLFYSETARAEFVLSPDSAISSADGRWQEILQELPN